MKGRLAGPKNTSLLVQAASGATSSSATGAPLRVTAPESPMTRGSTAGPSAVISA
jgi:hypothetical protein